MKAGFRVFPADLLFFGYHFAVLLVVGVRAWAMDAPLAPFAFNAFAIGCAYVICRFASPSGDDEHSRRGQSISRFVRLFYPFFFFLPIYEQVGTLNRFWVAFEWDMILRNADQMLFGFQPALLWSQVWPQAWVSEIFHFAYFTYYVQFAGLALVLYYRKKRVAEFHRFMAAIGIAFYICNFLFLFLPALGPHSFANFTPASALQHPTEMPGYAFTSIMHWLYQWEIPGGYFPSAHVALTTVTLLASWHHKPERVVLWPLGILLIASTVYCGYHYAVDVLGGLGVGLLAHFAAAVPRNALALDPAGNAPG